MAIELPALPFERTALEPHISGETIDYHYGKHHKAYVDKLNELIAGTEFEGMTVEEIAKKSQGAIFNNAAQVWNHTFYWYCLQPGGAGEPSGKLADAINAAFGDFAKFKDRHRHLRFRLGVAGAAQGRHRGPGQHLQRRHPAHRRGHPADDLRRVGARLLHRLPQRPPEVPRALLEPGELGVRRQEHEVSRSMR